MNELVIVRGGGDLATGVIQKLYRSGFKVLVLETPKPLAIRRTVAVSEAIYEGETSIEDLTVQLVQNETEMNQVWDVGKIPIIVDEMGLLIDQLKPLAVVDAIIAKRNLGTKKIMAPITIGLGPGFVAGEDVDIVVETMRGHQLGRLIFIGEAIKNTGVPGDIGGESSKRVIHSPCMGILHHAKTIGETVNKDEIIAYVDETPITSHIAGVLRGMMRVGTPVYRGLKIADVDPRLSEIENYTTISDKSRTIGGAVLEAVLYLKHKRRL